MASFLDGIFDPGKDERRRAQEVLDGVRTPDASDLELKLQKLVQMGEITPEDIETILQGESAYKTIGTDPRLAAAQYDSLADLRGVADAGGLDARAVANLDEAIGAQRTASRGSQDAIRADAQRRGISGSGMELVSRFIADQEAATRGNKAAIESAALAQQRRDAAIRDSASLAGSMDDRRFSQQATVAGAEDAIDRYNAVNAQNVAAQNVQARNVARAANLAEKQRVSDSNVGLENKQRERAANMPLTIYDLQRGNAQDRAGYQMGEAQAADARNQQLASLATSAAMAFAMSDERVKEDVEPLDSSEILRDLDGYTYSYQGDPSGERHDGVMAQDMERGPLADFVSEDDSGVKRIDYGGMGFADGREGSMTMGLMADINRRIEELEGSIRG